MEKTKTYDTSDLDVAAFFFYQGLEDYSLDHSNPERVLFCFKDAPRAQQLHKDYIFIRTKLREQVMRDGDYRETLPNGRN